MSAIDEVFAQLRTAGKKAFMPFVTAGDPDLEFTGLVLAELVRRGANLCELGIPYSDPIADGPVVQASYARALENKLKLADILGMLSEQTPKLTAPVVTMVSYAIVLRYGLERYVEDAQRAGAAGAIVPDLPADEAGELSKICRAADFSLIQLVAPTTTKDRARRIIETSSGFIYYVSVTGITGERQSLPTEVSDSVAWLKERTSMPICIGFGVSQPEHVRQLRDVADGLIVGSAIVRRVAEAATRPRDEVLREIGDYVQTLVDAFKD